MKDINLELSNFLEDDEFSFIEDNKEIYENDLFFSHSNFKPQVVLLPKSKEKIKNIIRFAGKHNKKIYIVGGGFSYTNSYSPEIEDSLLIDLSRLNKVIEVNKVSRYVIVEAGCTWKKLYEELSVYDMIVDFPAPLSGSHSTVGGAISQGVPGGMHGVLGLEVILPNNTLIRTGSWALKNKLKPFYRNYGPDTSGLFIGDNGIYGIKLSAALHLKPRQKGKAYASFDFQSYDDLAQTMIELSQFDFIVRRTGLDPYETRNISKVGLGDGIKTVLESLKENESLFKKLSNTVSLLKTGISFLNECNWTLHLKVDGINDEHAEISMQQAREVCQKKSREIPSILPRARDLVGFSIRKFLGPNGERWVATSGLFPIEESKDIAQKVQLFFKKEKQNMEKFNVMHSFITNFSQYYFLCEPCFYWNDKLSIKHLNNLSHYEREKFSTFPENPSTRSYVVELRNRLREFFFTHGAVHVQIGNFYNFRDSLDDNYINFLSLIKNTLDPNIILNPGKLDSIGIEDK